MSASGYPPSSHEEFLKYEEQEKQREKERIVVNLDDYPEVVCSCGHCCCVDCKCAENPDPVRGMTLCPCKGCKDSTKVHEPDHYSNPRKYFPKNQKREHNEECYDYRNMYPVKHV